MKKILLTLSLALFSTIAFSQHNMQDLIQKYKGHDDINIVTISGSFLRMGSSFIDANDEESQSVKEILEQVDELIIVNTSSQSKGRSIRKSLDEIIDNGDYEEMITVNSEGEEIKFYGRVRNNMIKELFVVTGDNPKETSIISMSGDISPRNVQMLLEKVNED